ncbi:hypothetical protein ANO11243_023650 [Dothideomycetidae sp. 11243]|nr:hypothetical protein ANO11243_023650 [fungal sp. No.11243]
MASGYGLAGGPSRCFPFWQEVLACYVSNTASGSEASAKAKCVPALDDYYECLHHRKEAARTRNLQAAYRRAEQGLDRSQMRTADEIRGLGLVSGTQDEAGVKDAPALPRFAK